MAGLKAPFMAVTILVVAGLLARQKVANWFSAIIRVIAALLSKLCGDSGYCCPPSLSVVNRCLWLQHRLVHHRLRLEHRSFLATAWWPSAHRQSCRLCFQNGTKHLLRLVASGVKSLAWKVKYHGELWVILLHYLHILWKSTYLSQFQLARLLGICKMAHNAPGISISMILASFAVVHFHLAEKKLLGNQDTFRIWPHSH